MRIDDEFLRAVGLGDMPEQEKQAFLKHATEELEARVGREIGKNLTDEQLSEFDAIENDDEAMNWLAMQVPEYKQIVKNVFEEFKKELRDNRQQILG